MGCFACSLRTELLGDSHGSAVKICLFAKVLWDSSTWASAARYFEKLFLGRKLKYIMLDVCAKPFTPQGKTGSLVFPSKCMVLCQGLVYGESVSQPLLPFFDVGIFSFVQFAQSVGVTRLHSGFSQRELLYLSRYSSCICGKRKIQELTMSLVLVWNL